MFYVYFIDLSSVEVREINKLNYKLSQDITVNTWLKFLDNPVSLQGSRLKRNSVTLISCRPDQTRVRDKWEINKREARQAGLHCSRFESLTATYPLLYYIQGRINVQLFLLIMFDAVSYTHLTLPTTYSV